MHTFLSLLSSSYIVLWHVLLWEEWSGYDDKQLELVIVRKCAATAVMQRRKFCLDRRSVYPSSKIKVSFCCNVRTAIIVWYSWTLIINIYVKYTACVEVNICDIMAAVMLLCWVILFYNMTCIKWICVICVLHLYNSLNKPNVILIIIK